MRQLFLILCALISVLPAVAGEDKTEAKEDFGNPKIDSPARFATEKSGVFGGQRLKYRTVAEDIFIRSADGSPIATYFTFSYLKKEVTDPSTRPVAFLFNGGPGSSSMWLHMSVFGPERLVLPQDLSDDGAPPYKVVENPETVLDAADLVFIDPVGTGLSRALGDEDPRNHWGVLEDGRSVAEFIRQWVDKHNRWNSPKFIIGESYGTTRASVVANELTDRYGIGLNGVVLVSAVLDFQNSRFQDGSIMSFVSYLPTYAATAWYHNQLPQKPENLESFLDEVRAFARTDYAQALIAGNRLTPAEQSTIIDKLHAYTGLKKSYLKATNMRIDTSRFYKELMRDEGKVVGRIDTRYLNEEPDSAGEFFKADPFITAVDNAFVFAINNHLKNFLRVNLENRRYNIWAADHERWQWNWSLWGDMLPNGGQFVNVVPLLGNAMRHNGDMQVLLASGYYDLATPFFGAENALAEADIVQDRVHYTYYESGHMMYVHEPSRIKFLQDIRRFINQYNGLH